MDIRNLSVEKTKKDRAKQKTDGYIIYYVDFKGYLLDFFQQGDIAIPGEIEIDKKLTVLYDDSIINSILFYINRAAGLKLKRLSPGYFIKKNVEIKTTYQLAINGVEHKRELKIKPVSYAPARGGVVIKALEIYVRSTEKKYISEILDIKHELQQARFMINNANYTEKNKIHQIKKNNSFNQNKQLFESLDVPVAVVQLSKDLEISSYDTPSNFESILNTDKIRGVHIKEVLSTLYLEQNTSDILDRQIKRLINKEKKYVYNSFTAINPEGKLTRSFAKMCASFKKNEIIGFDLKIKHLHT